MPEWLCAICENSPVLYFVSTSMANPVGHGEAGHGAVRSEGRQGRAKKERGEDRQPSYFNTTVFEGARLSNKVPPRP